jgi:FkbM family methyltransferase
MLPCPLRASRHELELYCRRAAAAIAYGRHPILCRILGNWPFLVDNRDPDIAPHLLLDGYWEAWVTLALARAAYPGTVCIDVGAAYGYYTILFAAATGSSGTTLAVEPNPAFVRYLTANRRLTGLNYQIHQTALADSDSPAAPFSTNLPHGGARLTTTKTRLAVPVTTLDHLTHDLPRCDLVKVDVEAAELAVWRGATQLRKRHNPTWLIELHTLADNSAALTLLEEAAGAGYPLRTLNADGDLETHSAAEIASMRNPHLWLSTS